MLMSEPTAKKLCKEDMYVCPLNRDIYIYKSSCVLCLQEVKKGGKSLNHKPQIMFVVPYRRWSLTRGSNCKALTGKVLVFWIGGRIWRFDYIIILGLQPRDKGVNTKRIFSQRIYMKIELVPRGGKCFCS